jgi:hypothetical protein
MFCVCYPSLFHCQTVSSAFCRALQIYKFRRNCQTCSVVRHVSRGTAVGVARVQKTFKTARKQLCTNVWTIVFWGGFAGANLSPETTERAERNTCKGHVNRPENRTSELVNGGILRSVPSALPFVKCTIVKCQSPRELSHAQNCPVSTSKDMIYIAL